jgi:hypothetical protein
MVVWLSSQYSSATFNSNRIIMNTIIDNTKYGPWALVTGASSIHWCRIYVKENDSQDADSK